MKPRKWYDEKYKELEEIVNPIFAKIYGAAGGAGGPGGMPNFGEEDMPSHDEL